MVGWITVSTTSGVRTRPDNSSSCSRNPAIVRMSKVLVTKPTAPASPKISGGSEDSEERRLSAQSHDPITETDGGRFGDHSPDSLRPSKSARRRFKTLRGVL
jgi:hypothetical protein